LVHSFVIVDVNGERDLVDDLEGIFEGVLEGGDDHNRVDISL
jgi:hypothetical protein